MDASKPRTDNPSENEQNDLFKLYCHLPIKDLRPGKYQPRKYFDDTSLEELAGSIKKDGILQPLLVRTIGHKEYEIIAGERRWRAAKLAGLNEVPVLIREINDEDALAFGILENLQREDLNAIEEAESFQKLIHEFKLTHEVVSARVGKSRAYITNSIRLLNLPQKIQESLARNELQVGHAKAIATLEGEMLNEAFHQIISKKLSVRQTEALSKKLLSPPSKKNDILSIDEDITNLEKELSKMFQMPCKIVLNKNRPGTLQFSFDNNVDKLKRRLLAYKS